MLGRAAAITVAALTVATVVPAFADLEVYWTKDPASANTAPPGGQWFAGAPPDSLPPDSLNLWMAVLNTPDAGRFKFLHINLDGTGGWTWLSTPEDPVGFMTKDTSEPVYPSDSEPGPEDTSYEYNTNWAYSPQPHWERLLLSSVRNPLERIAWTTVRVGSICTDATWADPLLELNDTSFEAPGASAGNPRWTEVFVFPRHGAAGATPTFSAPPSTGTWSSSIVFTDPDGNPRPGGGVRFTSNGAGLTNADQFDATVPINGGPVYLYDVYAYDAAADHYDQYKVRAGLLVPNSTPWLIGLVSLALASMGMLALRKRVA